jgi:(2R)-3-sulfolactate dehydrogenase (NADP+)
VTILTLEALHELAVSVLVASKTAPGNAVLVADALVAAEADGLVGHGASRIPSYADQSLSGKADGFATPELYESAAAALRVDARDGFAYPAIALGLENAVHLVERTGIVAVAITNSHHFGAAGYHVERMAEEGLVALAFGNSPAAIAPWGGSRALFGTNPIAFACPRTKASPLVIDLSLSKVARGKIMVAAKEGKSIPEGWALNADGQPTTNAEAAMAGTMLPMGDAKGAALVLMVEILSAVLTGANCGFQASSFFTAEGPPPRVGQFFLVMNTACFSGDGFQKRLETLLEAIIGQTGCRLPGERRLANRERARRDGVEIPDSLHADILTRLKTGGDT